MATSDLSAMFGLTEKQRAFCMAFVACGDAQEAYLQAYDSKSEVSARNEGNKLLRNEKIQSYLLELQKPIKVKAFRDRDRKRERLWTIIEDPESTNADVCRAMDILNKLDGEYITGNRDIDGGATDISQLDVETLKQIAN